jgi:hypothetical protein
MKNSMMEMLQHITDGRKSNNNKKYDFDKPKG